MKIVQNLKNKSKVKEMSSTQTSTFTDSALSDKVKDFLDSIQRHRFGNYKYVEAIDEMMPKNSKYIIVDYNDLVVRTRN